MSSPLDELERLKAECVETRAQVDHLMNLEGNYREYRQACDRHEEASDAYHSALSRHADYLISAARDAERLRDTKQWFDQQLDDIRFYSGTSSATWKRLVEQLKERFDSARKEEG